MKYYFLTIEVSLEEIKERANGEGNVLKNYRYGKPIEVLNNYCYHNLRTGIGVVGFQEKEEYMEVFLLFDERRYSLQETYTYITDILHDVFGMKRLRNLSEITAFQAIEYYFEARRREYLSTSESRFMDSAKLWPYYLVDYDATRSFKYYEFEERIIETDKKKEMLFDPGFVKELHTIETHENKTNYDGNLVHYILSGRSTEATLEMAEMLVQSLVKAKRISSSRMEIICEMAPVIYQKDSYMECIVENACGGTVVFDLTEKFGYESTEYTMACKYLIKLLKKYRNQCLFIFMYNMDAPGFSYQLLPELSKYVLPIQLREGTGDREAAISYMKSRIRGSKYSAYAEQAEEFMAQFSGNLFTQTEVLKAYEQFEAWCLNKNVLQAYTYHPSDTFMLDRNEHAASSYEKLQQMIGLGSVKRQIDGVIAADIVEKERKRRRGNTYVSTTMHMIFGGNPGTAKTTVAKLFAGIAREKGILKSGAFVEKGGMDLDGLGCVCAIREAFCAASGGVLFIDEAYAMKSDTAITVLLQEMENQRENVIVVLAGYRERMQSFLERNEGLKSRIPYWIDFPGYDADELTAIMQMMLKERGFHVTEDAITEAHYILDKVQHIEDFSNGRYVRNFVEKAIQKQSVRLLAERENVCDIRKEDLFLLKKEDICMPEEVQKEREAGSAQKELDKMIGLPSVKTVLHKIIANYKLNKLCDEKGMPKRNASLHMVFTGNPGTCKTTIARLVAEIMKDENILSMGRFVETGRADLVGQVVGATAPLIRKKFKEAQGGILFIDEAYSLCDGYENGYGDEAINTLVQEMENHREDVIVIFAGYPEPMQQFLDRNPGMQSRIAFQVKFEDYSTDELCEITKLMLNEKQMSITDAAMNKLRGYYDRMRQNKNFGNGRFVRKMLEGAELNMAARITKLEEGKITPQLISVIEECDIPELQEAGCIQTKKIGFLASTSL